MSKKSPENQGPEKKPGKKLLAVKKAADLTGDVITGTIGGALKVIGTVLLILLGGLTKDRLDHLLAQLKESELTIELKAVITPYNREWTLAKLFSELQEEHRFFLRIQRLTQLTEQAEARADGDAKLRAAALEGRRILEADKAPEPLTLQNAIEGLEAALSRL